MSFVTNTRAQARVSCGFNGGFARFNSRRECGPTHLKSGAFHNYPITCPQPKVITVERVVQLEGVDNALFLVGDVQGYRQNRNYTVEIPTNAINVTSGNFPSYLLLKDGDMHTLGFSTGNIEGFLRQNAHMFSRNGITRADVSYMPDLAPQDMSVEGMGGHCHEDKREFRFRIVNNTTMNDASTTIEVTVFECGTLIDREVWYIIPVRTENGETAFGANWFAWDSNPNNFGGCEFIPGRSTDNGTFVVANIPRRDRCGRGSQSVRVW